MAGIEHFGNFLLDCFTHAGDFSQFTLFSKLGYFNCQFLDFVCHFPVCPNLEPVLFFFSSRTGNFPEYRGNFEFVMNFFPQQCLYFLPLPQGQGSFLPIFLPSIFSACLPTSPPRVAAGHLGHRGSGLFGERPFGNI